MGPAAVAYFASRLHGLYALALADGVEVEVSRVQGVQLMSWPAAGSEQHPGDDSDSVGKGEADSAEVEASKESFMWSELQAWHAAMVAPSVCAYARWDARFVLPTWTAVAAPTPTRARPRPMAQVHKTQVQTLYLTVG